MASAAVGGKEDEHCCPVCSELFTQPKILSCGHLLCRGCAVSWLKEQPNATCPLCRYPIVGQKEPAGGKSVEDVVDGFPTDLCMETWVEGHRLLSQHHKCQACVNQPATAICVTCRDLLCASCAAIHKRMSVSRHHTVEELSSLTPEKLASSRPSFCSTHPADISKVYCPTHGASICLLCATTSHRQCPDVSQLETKIQEGRAELADMRAKLQEKEADLDQAIQRLDQHLQDMQEKVKVTAAEIRTVCDRLESAVKKCRKRLEDLLHGASRDAEEAVREVKTHVSQQRGRVMVHEGVVQRAEGADSHDVIHGMVSGLKTQVGSVVCSSPPPPDTKVMSFTMVIDQEAAACVERDLARLGQLKVEPVDLVALVFKAAHTPALTPESLCQKPAALKFHAQKKGDNIVLSNNQQTAERSGFFLDGCIVLSCEPMEVNCLYQVRVVKANLQQYRSYTCLGVLTQDLDTVTLPQWADGLTAAVLVGPGWVRVNDTERKDTVGSSLPEVTEGGRVGLMLDHNRTLYLYINDQSQGVVTSDLPHPCYFLVDLFPYWKKVTALPVQRLK